MAELADALDSGSSEGNFMQVQVLLPAPKNKGLLRLSFIFIQSEGLVCNRRKAYVISSQSELYVIKSQDLYVPFLRIDYIPFFERITSTPAV